MDPASILCLSSCTWHFSLEAIQSVTSLQLACWSFTFLFHCMDGPFTVGAAASGSNLVLWRAATGIATQIWGPNTGACARTWLLSYILSPCFLKQGSHPRAQASLACMVFIPSLPSTGISDLGQNVWLGLIVADAVVVCRHKIFLRVTHLRSPG